jgi:type I restriction enzyme S subunit
MPVNIGENRINREGIACVTEHDANRLAQHRVRVGDIVYSRRGDVERRALVREPEDGWLCGTGCLKVRLGAKVVDPLFASYQLGHPAIRQWIVQHAVGATMPNLNTSIMAAVPFALPPLPEQKAIARILGTLDDKIELNRRMNATLEAMARALFQSWFVDFDPVHAKAAGRPPSGMDAPTAALFPASFQSSPLGEIPDGWTIEPLENLAAIRGGKQLPTEDCRPTGTFPVFGANGIMGYTEQTTHLAFVIAFGRVGAYCGSIHWSLDGAWINNNASAVVPSGSSEYVLQAMLGVDFHSMRTGSAQPFIPNSALASAKLTYPGRKIAEAFTRVIAPLRRLQADNENQSRTLATLRDTLLPKLLSGELSTATAA